MVVLVRCIRKLKYLLGVCLVHSLQRGMQLDEQNHAAFRCVRSVVVEVICHLIIIVYHCYVVVIMSLARPFICLSHAAS